MKKYFTENNTDVSLRVQNGLTKVFTCPTEAYQHARQTGSYHYPLYGVKGGFAGYAVPK
ncbi:hypothetical protein [Aquimarina algiphila]|uniref:hypothetical protein n=1 Tax=Aquimarina algiphila TaxID=2047982 RepID=UPI00142FEE6E|nr:hypothetical protein [Aquimarina algiphila]